MLQLIDIRRSAMIGSGGIWTKIRVPRQLRVIEIWWFSEVTNVSIVGGLVACKVANSRAKCAVCRYIRMYDALVCSSTFRNCYWLPWGRDRR